jgi:hypothetical protein
MTPHEILKKCREEDVTLSVKGGRLEFYGPKDALTDDFLSLLKTYKADLISILHVMETFKSAGWHGTIVPDPSRVVYHNFTPVLCPYKDKVREIHPDVCGWHRQAKDPECQGCENRVLH